jgi:hypothetical protein
MKLSESKPPNVGWRREWEGGRKIEAAELMVATSKFTISYARSFLAARPQSPAG